MITNRDTLLEHGNADVREIPLDIAERALEAMHPDRAVRETIRLDDNALVIDGRAYDLTIIDDVYVIGAGKGSLHVVEAVARVLGDVITTGIVVEKHGQGRAIDAPGGEVIDVLEASHPIPDDAGRTASEAILELADSADEDDLVIACITGGASALLPVPADDITLDDKAELTRLLLEAGAPIQDVNTIRKHVSDIKGGRLAERIHPARLVSLIIIDEVAGVPWGPTIPDETTFEDAIRSLERHDLWDRTPTSVRDRLHRGADDSSLETPDPSRFESIGIDSHVVVLADAEDVCEAAVAVADRLDVEPMILSTVIEGEGREVGTCLAGIAIEAATNGRPIEPPCVFISGGETTVTVSEHPGEGGPNQEFALGVARTIADRPEIAAVALDTDGTDGPTDVAGGIVDGTTMARAAERDVDVFEALRRNDAARVLRSLSDAVFTSPTGTNVMDLRVLFVGDRADDS